MVRCVDCSMWLTSNHMFFGWFLEKIQKHVITSTNNVAGRISYSHWGKKEKRKNLFSLAGNWTPVSRVTGGDTHHYTTKDMFKKMLELNVFLIFTINVAFLRGRLSWEVDYNRNTKDLRIFNHIQIGLLGNGLWLYIHKIWYKNWISDAISITITVCTKVWRQYFFRDRGKKMWKNMEKTRSPFIISIQILLKEQKNYR